MQLLQHLFSTGIYAKDAKTRETRVIVVVTVRSGLMERLLQPKFLAILQLPAVNTLVISQQSANVVARFSFIGKSCRRQTIS